jgi:hypothetical protein
MEGLWKNRLDLNGRLEDLSLEEVLKAEKAYMMSKTKLDAELEVYDDDDGLPCKGQGVRVSGRKRRKLDDSSHNESGDDDEEEEEEDQMKDVESDSSWTATKDGKSTKNKNKTKKLIIVDSDSDTDVDDTSTNHEGIELKETLPPGLQDMKEDELYVEDSNQSDEEDGSSSSSTSSSSSSSDNDDEDVEEIEEIVWAKLGPYNPWWPGYLAEPNEDQARDGAIPPQFRGQSVKFVVFYGKTPSWSFVGESAIRKFEVYNHIAHTHIYMSCDSLISIAVYVLYKYMDAYTLTSPPHTLHI